MSPVDAVAVQHLLDGPNRGGVDASWTASTATSAGNPSASARGDLDRLADGGPWLALPGEPAPTRHPPALRDAGTGTAGGGRATGIETGRRAEIVAQGASGTRTIAIDEFFADYYTTALNDGELITEIRIPGGQSQSAYAKFSRRAQDWAIIGAAVSKGSGGWRVALCGAAATAVRASGVEQALASGASAADAAAHAGEGIAPEPGLDGSTEYKRHLASVMVRRALETAGA